jgi:hypothetical protein
MTQGNKTDDYFLTKLQLVADEQLGKCDFKEDLQLAIDEIKRNRLALADYKVKVNPEVPVDHIDYVEQAKLLSQVMQNPNLSLKTKERFIDALPDAELRGIFKEVAKLWVSK